MRILLEPSSHNHNNLGNVAMLQVAVRRLHAIWPDARIQVFTDDADRLRLYCPEAEALSPEGRRVWFEDKAILGRGHDLLPSVVSRSLVRVKNWAKSQAPAAVKFALRGRRILRGQERQSLEAFWEAAAAADLVAWSGSGGITDHARDQVVSALHILRIGIDRGVPSAVFSHGLGPLRDEDLFRRAAADFRHVSLIALRERRVGPALLARMGVAEERVMITGDDAVELAYTARPEVLGRGLGVNIRVSRSAAATAEDVDTVGGVLRQFARDQGVPLVELPINLANPYLPRGSESAEMSDIEAIERLMSGWDGDRLESKGIVRPEDLIARVGLCRVVVTGAYHAAVFALSQGIPAVTLARSDYFAEKLAGLADMFLTGCEAVDLREPDAAGRLMRSVRRFWEEAETFRAPLLLSAARQIDSSLSAYRRCQALVDGTATWPTEGSRGLVG